MTEPERGPEAGAAGTRRRARELAFRVLFEAENGGADLRDVLEHALQENARLGLNRSRGRAEGEDGHGEPLDPEGVSFARHLATAFDEHRYEVDQTLQRVIEGWTFNQMSRTDVAVLRLAAVEIMFDRTPAPPVIEVAVRIAKKYGGEESGRFVNGVLARLLRHLDENAAGGQNPDPAGS
ncbi:MAG TPA: transcription antitermination factor NusB [Deinococcales bacterium]|nr:transcription antitermination factor NusB [Deinococcales bacterium]